MFFYIYIYRSIYIFYIYHIVSFIQKPSEILDAACGFCGWSILANVHEPQLTIYHKVSNIRRILVGNKIIDHSDVVGASPVGAAETTPGFNGLGKDNRKTTRETFVFWDWVRLILENWRVYVSVII